MHYKVCCSACLSTALKDQSFFSSQQTLWGLQCLVGNSFNSLSAYQQLHILNQNMVLFIPHHIYKQASDEWKCTGQCSIIMAECIIMQPMTSQPRTNFFKDLGENPTRRCSIKWWHCHWPWMTLTTPNYPFNVNFRLSFLPFEQVKQGFKSGVQTWQVVAYTW